MDNWIKDIEHKMADFEMSPPENLWEGIEKRLEERAVRKRIGMRRYIRWAAAAAFIGAVITVGGGLWMNSHRDGDATPPPVVAQKPRDCSSFPKAEEDVTATVTKDITAAVVPTPPATTAPIDEPAAEDKEVETLPEKKEEPVTKKPEEHRKSDYRRDTRHPKWNAAPRRRKYAASRFNVSLLASNFLSSSNGMNGYSELASGTIWTDGSLGGEGVSSDYEAMEEIIVGNNDRDVYTKKKHRLPVKAGISVSYRIDSRLSVGTGLVYSYLSSDLSSGTDEYYYATRQSLQYIGIPLNLSYTVLRGKRWSVYGTGGGMVEKCVKGSSTTDYVVNGESESTQHDKVKDSRLQYSLNAAIGIEVKSTERIGIYVEPGISYHFNNHSNVTNIYKDTPLNFSLGVGVRYSF